MYRKLAIFSFVLLLSGCVTADIKDEVRTSINIIDVEVSLKEDVAATPSLPENFRNALMHYASIYNQTQFGRVSGYILRVEVTYLHYKNPMLSLLLGDANSISVFAKLVDPDDNTTKLEFKKLSIDGASAILNGLSGAILSAAVSKEKAEATLMKMISSTIMKTAYRKRSLHQNLKRELGKKDIFTPVTEPISQLSRMRVIVEEDDKASANPGKG